MGLDRHCIAYLAAVEALGVRYSRTLTLGRQTLMCNAAELEAALCDAGRDVSTATAEALVARSGGFCETLFAHLGADVVESVDGSSYEDCTFVHDLNTPLSVPVPYSVVLDGGTLEHVFDFPTALKSSMEAVAVGGHYVAITPVNGYAGHGFYQLAPELYHRALSPANGFEMRCMLWRGHHPLARWYHVPDPQATGSRVERLGRFPALLFLAAQRTEDVPVFAQPPQQSDYAAQWQTGASTFDPAPFIAPDQTSRLRRAARVYGAAVRELRSDLRSLPEASLRDLGSAAPPAR